MAKAQAVAYYLRGLANTKYSPLLSAVRRAVYTYIELVLLYGVEV